MITNSLGSVRRKPVSFQTGFSARPKISRCLRLFTCLLKAGPFNKLDRIKRRLLAEGWAAIEVNCEKLHKIVRRMPCSKEPNPDEDVGARHKSGLAR